MALACGVRAHRESRFHDKEIVGAGKSKLRMKEKNIYLPFRYCVDPRSLHNNAQIL